MVCGVTVPPGTYIVTAYGRADEIPQSGNNRVFFSVGSSNRTADMLIKNSVTNAQEGFSLTRIETVSSSVTMRACIYPEGGSITIPANKIHLQVIRIK